MNSIDDVAALLIQIEPSDTPGLTRILDALNKLVAEESYPEPVQLLLNKCARKIDEVIKKNVPDPDAAVAAAGMLLDEAMVAIEENGSRERRDPAPGPDCEPSTGEKMHDEWPNDIDSDLMKDFITECHEYIEGAEKALLIIERDTDDSEAVNTVFRAFHTIKGTSLLLGFTLVSDLAHQAESLLSRVRDRKVRCTGVYADLALSSIDMLKELMHVVEDILDGKPGTRPDGYDELLRILTDPEAELISGKLDGMKSSPSDTSGASEAYPENHQKREEVTHDSQDTDNIRIAGHTPRAATPARDLKPSLNEKRSEETGPKKNLSVRIRTDLLDRLFDTIGELVIAHSMVAQDSTLVSCESDELMRKVSHAGKIVRELENLSMAMRMVPMRKTFLKMTRLVRDLAHKSGKSIEFITVGEDTEIDRNMVEVINDPLVHMIRNAIDHGLELPDERERRGKPGKGMLKLSACHSGGNVIIALKDDGRGLSRSEIVKKAVSMRLIENDNGMVDREIFNLIFEPGFSTAEKVTDVSGRGVGMDVVRNGVESLRGRLDISSEPGQGSTFTITLPLTLANFDGMLVRVGDQRFIIPVLDIRITFRPGEGKIYRVTQKGEMVMHHGVLMPVFRLHTLFDISRAVEEAERGILVIVSDGEKNCALLVDALLGQHQVVAKSLGQGIGRIQGILGGTILGDGRVGLILDSQEIVSLARQVSESGNGGGNHAQACAGKEHMSMEFEGG